MRIRNASELGEVVRARRKALGYTQVELAEYCHCGVRFVSDLENGKETVQFGKVIEVLSMLGINIFAETRGQK